MGLPLAMGYNPTLGHEPRSGKADADDPFADGGTPHLAQARLTGLGCRHRVRLKSARQNDSEQAARTSREVRTEC